LSRDWGRACRYFSNFFLSPAFAFGANTPRLMSSTTIFSTTSFLIVLASNS
jgi:hypothetical protein